MSRSIVREQLNRRRIYSYLIILVVLILLFHDVLWILSDRRIPSGYQAFNLSGSFNVFQMVKTGNWSGFFSDYTSHQPSLLCQYSAVLFLIFGSGDRVAVMGILPFLMILMFSVFLLGRLLWDDETGFWSALISIGSLNGVALSHSFLSALPVASLSAFSLVSLIYSDSFRKKGWTLIFSAVSALAVLMSWTALIIILPVALPVCMQAVKNMEKDGEMPVMLKIRALMLLACVVAGIFSVYQRSAFPGDFMSAWLFSALPMALLILIYILFPVGPVAMGNLLNGIGLFLILAWHDLVIKPFFHAGDRLFLDNPGYFIENSAISAGFISGWPSLLLLLGFTSYGIWFYLRSKERTPLREQFLTGLAVAVLFMPVLASSGPGGVFPVMIFVSVFAVFWIPRLKTGRIAMLCRSGLVALFIMAIMGWGIPVIPQIPLHAEKMEWKMSEIWEGLRNLAGAEPAVVAVIMDSSALVHFTPDFLPAVQGKAPDRLILDRIRVRNIDSSGILNTGEAYRFYLTLPLNRSDISEIETLVLIRIGESREGSPETGSLEELLDSSGLSGDGRREGFISLPGGIDVEFIRVKMDTPIRLNYFFPEP